MYIGIYKSRDGEKKSSEVLNYYDDNDDGDDSSDYIDLKFVLDRDYLIFISFKYGHCT